MVQPIELCEMADDLRRRIVRFDFGFFASLLLFLTPSIMAQAPNNSRQVVHEARKLKLGESVEQVLAGGETHLFQIKLKKNEYLQATVEQRSIDVGVTLIGPDGKPVGKSDSFISGTELIMAVAEAAGIHCLEVSSSVDPNTAGRYEVKIEALRKATPEDTTRVAAWKAAKRLFAEAAKLDEKGTPESRRQAIEKFKAAALLFKLANDQHREIYTLSRLGSAYQLLGEYQNAMAYYNQVLPYWQACGNYQMEGATLSGLGQSQVMTGLLKDGRDNLLRSLPLLRKGE
jgi:tetratricopeptide (TPR) repeat protein